MGLSLRRRKLSIPRLALFILIVLAVRIVWFKSHTHYATRFVIEKWNTSRAWDIPIHGFLERVSANADKTLNPKKYPFMQSRWGRPADSKREDEEGTEERGDDLFYTWVKEGMAVFWERIIIPYTTNKETQNQDTQHVLSAIDQLLSLNGWVAAACPTLLRPFGTNKHQFESVQHISLQNPNHLYYLAIVIHSADHFLVDQLALIVQIVKRVGADRVFVSMVDYHSSDSTETLLDLSEAVLTLLSIPFRIKRIPPMTIEPSAAYYPKEEAFMRNVALEPLRELKERRRVEFRRVIWVKGFMCPNDVFEMIRVSEENEAAMTCGMDWADAAVSSLLGGQVEPKFVFSDRWRTRDIQGDQFRQSTSSSKSSLSVPPRDAVSSVRYTKHLPFQVFCCESGTHVVDPHQAYYRGIEYRFGEGYQNLSLADTVRSSDSDDECLDSSQMWFCRDLWVLKGSEGMDLEEGEPYPVHGGSERTHMKRQELPVVEEPEDKRQFLQGQKHRLLDTDKNDIDADAGSDFDAMPDADSPPLAKEDPDSISDTVKMRIPNSSFRPARILINPRSVNTYAGVSHARLARDLFEEVEEPTVGPVWEEEAALKERKEEGVKESKFVLEDWEGAPESFVCQEQRTTGGRTATKTQRRLGFSIHEEVRRGVAATASSEKIKNDGR